MTAYTCYMGHLDAPFMTLNEEREGQGCRYIKETCICVQNIIYKENEPSTEEKKPQEMLKKKIC